MAEGVWLDQLPPEPFPGVGLTADEKRAKNFCHVDGCYNRATYYELASDWLYCPEHWKGQEGADLS
jgi:hypothetical protein